MLARFLLGGLLLISLTYSTTVQAAYPLDCKGPGEPSGLDCGGLTYEGCCDAWGRNVWCQEDRLYCWNCPSLDPAQQACGWSNQFYNCGGAGADPTGVFPLQCGAGCNPACTKPQYCDGGTCADCVDPKCGELECGNAPGCPGSGVTCGECSEGLFCNKGMCGICPPGEIEDCDGVCAPEIYIGDGACDDGGFGANFDCEAFNSDGGDCGPCVPNCDGKFCGNDGCGSSCGTCLEDFYCDEFANECVACSCGDAVCGTNQCGDSCGSCPAEQGCEGGQCVVCGADKVVDCNGRCAPQGWIGDGICDDNPGGISLNCEAFEYDGGDCLPCLPECTGKVCGDDGCGGSCGECLTTEYCEVATATCKVCNCDDKQCGMNECKVSCGTCAEGTYCDASQQCQVCGCDGKECGDDGCGESCGSCAWPGEACLVDTCLATPCTLQGEIIDCVGECSPASWVGDGFCDKNPDYGHFNCDQFLNDGGDCQPCTPQCDGKQCGDDGCGFPCGQCEAGTYCSIDQCVACSCGTAVCGVDQCGQSCGSCAEGLSCTNGQCAACAAGTILDCNGNCGKEEWLGDNYCDDSAWGTDFNCEQFNFDNGDCEPCIPDCTGKSCGSDGCTGTCGECGAGQGCDPGSWQCITCDLAALCIQLDYECGPVRHGCEGDCGSCPGGQACVIGRCVNTTCPDPLQVPDCNGNCHQASWVGDGYCDDGEQYPSDFLCPQFNFDNGDCGVCAPDCTGKQCGSDGCGGSCGVCGDEEQCTIDGVCEACGCGTQQCGFGVCGEGCGTCAAELVCDLDVGLCISLNDVPKHCLPSDGPGCPGCACEACVCAADAFCCSTQWDPMCSQRCVAECGGEVCPMVCVPNCEGRECGGDGCGGTCGECEAYESCLEAAGGSMCMEDLCGLGLGTAGCCEGQRLFRCDEQGVLAVDDCGMMGTDYTCGWYPGDPDYTPGYYCGPAGVVVPEDPSGLVPPECPACVADCTGKQCGSDGCYGQCGTCADGELCVSGVCQVECIPDCAGKECGSDGCDGQCGVCEAPETCVDGLCEEPCVPDCLNRECGPDGCDGQCGECPANQTCDDKGICHQIPPDVVAQDLTETTTEPDLIPDTGKVDANADTVVSDIGPDAAVTTGGGSSGCSTTGDSTSTTLLLMLLALLALGHLRFVTRR